MDEKKKKMLEMTKSLLRSVIGSAKEVVAMRLQGEYRAIVGEFIPYNQLGFPDLHAFIETIPDVVRIGRNATGETVYKEVPNEATAHLAAFTKATKRKSSKARPHSAYMRRPTQFKPTFSRGGFGGGRGAYRGTFRSAAPRGFAPRGFAPRGSAPRGFTPRGFTPRATAPRGGFQSYAPRQQVVRMLPVTSFPSGHRMTGPRLSQSNSGGSTPVRYSAPRAPSVNNNQRTAATGQHSSAPVRNTTSTVQPVQETRSVKVDTFTYSSFPSSSSSSSSLILSSSSSSTQSLTSSSVTPSSSTIQSSSAPSAIPSNKAAPSGAKEYNPPPPVPSYDMPRKSTSRSVTPELQAAPQVSPQKKVSSQTAHDKNKVPSPHRAWPAINTRSFSNALMQATKQPTPKKRVLGEDVKAAAAAAVSRMKDVPPRYARLNAQNLEEHNSTSDDADSPIYETGAPTWEMQSPAQNTEPPAQNTQSFAQNTESPAYNTKSFAQNTESPAQNTESFVQNAESPTQNTQSFAHNTESFAQNTEAPTHNTLENMQNTQSFAQNTEASVQNIQPTTQHNGVSEEEEKQDEVLKTPEILSFNQMVMPIIESLITDYKTVLLHHCQRWRTRPVYEVIHVGSRINEGHVCVIKVLSQTYGSAGIFATPREAESAAAKNACEGFGLLKNENKNRSRIQKTPERNSNYDEDEVRSRVKEILDLKIHGLFSHRLPAEYKDKFNESAPEDLLERLSEWSDIVTIESVQVTGQKILYPNQKAVVRLNSQGSLTLSHVPDTVMPDAGDSVDVLMSQVYDCSHFFVRKQCAELDSLMAQLQEIYTSRGSPKQLVQPEVGMHCVALFTDEEWYRAEILSINQNKEVSYDVLYIDYGNCETVSSLRVRRILDNLCNLPAQAIRCCLLDCYPPQGDDWEEDSEAVEEMISITHGDDSLLVIDVISIDLDRGCMVKLYNGNNRSQEMADHLIQKGLASSEPISAEPPPLELPDDKDWDIFVCYINTTIDVVIRLVGPDTSEALSSLEEQLGDVVKSNIKGLEISIDGPKVGGIYMLREGDEEMLYNRVRVIEVADNKALVEFVDHGETDVVDVDRMKVLPAKYNQLPYQAIPAKLTGLESFENHETMVDQLMTLAFGKTFVATVDDRVDRVSVTLWDTSEVVDKNINEMVAEVLKIEDLSPEMPHVKGATLEGYVSHVAENGHVFFQIQGPGCKVLGDITAEMAQIFEKESTADMFVSKPVVGRLYCAKYYSDEIWYRVKVIQVLPLRRVEVCFVDCGNSDIVQLTKLRAITAQHSHIESLPHQAVECIQFNLPPDDYTWTERALERVLNLCPNDELRVLEVVYPGAPPQVELYFIDDEGEMRGVSECLEQEKELLFGDVFDEGHDSVLDTPVGGELDIVAVDTMDESDIVASDAIDASNVIVNQSIAEPEVVVDTQDNIADSDFGVDSEAMHLVHDIVVQPPTPDTHPCLDDNQNDYDIKPGVDDDDENGVPVSNISANLFNNTGAGDSLISRMSQLSVKTTTSEDTSSDYPSDSEFLTPGSSPQNSGPSTPNKEQNVTYATDSSLGVEATVYHDTETGSYHETSTGSYHAISTGSYHETSAGSHHETSTGPHHETSTGSYHETSAGSQGATQPLVASNTESQSQLVYSDKTSDNLELLTHDYSCIIPVENVLTEHGLDENFTLAENVMALNALNENVIADDNNVIYMDGNSPFQSPAHNTMNTEEPEILENAVLNSEVILDNQDEQVSNNVSLSNSMNSSVSGMEDLSHWGDDLSPSASKKLPLPPPIEFPKSGDDIFITWVVDPWNFWANVNSVLEDIGTMMQQMMEYFETDHPVPSIEDILESQVYAGFYDGSWYRVAIKGIVAETEQVKVHFVDYGDYSVLNVSEIRILPLRFRKLPFQAFQCKLEGVKPAHGQHAWPPETTERLTVLIQDKCVTAWIHSNTQGVVSHENILSVTLVDSNLMCNAFIHKILIEENLAAK